MVEVSEEQYKHYMESVEALKRLEEMTKNQEPKEMPKPEIPEFEIKDTCRCCEKDAAPYSLYCSPECKKVWMKRQARQYYLDHKEEYLSKRRKQYYQEKKMRKAKTGMMDRAEKFKALINGKYSKPVKVPHLPAGVYPVAAVLEAYKQARKDEHSGKAAVRAALRRMQSDMTTIYKYLAGDFDEG